MVRKSARGSRAAIDGTSVTLAAAATEGDAYGSSATTFMPSPRARRATISPTRTCQNENNHGVLKGGSATFPKTNDAQCLAFQLDAHKSASFPFSSLHAATTIWYIPCHG